VADTWKTNSPAPSTLNEECNEKCRAGGKQNVPVCAIADYGTHACQQHSTGHKKRCRVGLQSNESLVQTPSKKRRKKDREGDVDATMDG
jgi:hypothetical protein